MADDKIKVRLSSKNEGGYNTIMGRLFKEPIETEVTFEELRILNGEAPHIIVESVTDAQGGGNDDEPSAKELIEKVQSMTEVSELGKLLKDEKRVTVTNAIRARIKELKTAK